MATVEKFKVFFFILFLIGLPEYSWCRSKEHRKFLYAYTIFLNVLSKCALLSGLLNFKEFSEPLVVSLGSKVSELIDYMEMVYHCIEFLAIPVLVTLFYKANIEMLKSLGQLQNLTKVDTFSRFINLLSAFYFLYYLKLTYWTFHEFRSVLVFFLAVVSYILTVSYQIWVMHLLLRNFRSLERLELDNFESTQRAQANAFGYFGPFNLLNYVIMEFCFTFAVYFFIYRLNEQGWTFDLLMETVWFVVGFYTPYLTTFYAWKCCGEVIDEVSLNSLVLVDF